MPTQPRARRADVLAALGASAAVIEELLALGEGLIPRPDGLAALPLLPEMHVQTWRAYGSALAGDFTGTYGPQLPLPQLHFPVREGMSQNPAYRRATLQSDFFQAHYPSQGLELRSPSLLRLWIRESPAGPIPVLCTGERGDFVLLVQALSCRNEPWPVPDSMGACLVSGFNNVDRIRNHRERWLAGEFQEQGAKTWDEEFRRLVARKELYQDRFLILADGPYSNVPAGDLGLAPAEWLRLSHVIRTAHECTHYLTLRLFGVVRDQPVDELLADYVGIAAACGRYRADWFHRFMGLENYPVYRPGGRLANYQGKSPLSESAFRVLQALVYRAAENLERFDARRFSGPVVGRDRAFLIPELAQASLEELASGEAEALRC